MKKSVFVTGIVVALLAGPLSLVASARPEYARKEDKTCNYCHLLDQGGGARGFRGLYYASNKLSFKGFEEKVQAKLAGVKPDSMGKDTKPTKKPYPPKKKGADKK